MKTTDLLSLEGTKTLGKAFGTPLVVRGFTWLPLTWLAVWGVMSGQAGKGHPERGFFARLGIGALTTAAILGSEWCHNLAHAAAARAIGKPMDALRIHWGMPLCIYRDPNDPSVPPNCGGVTPRQHMLRALGGPLFNLLALPLALLARRLARPGSALWEAANAAAGMNTFLVGAGLLLPIPQLDGGTLLKWALVAKGQTRQAADETVLRVNRVSGVGLGVAAGVALKKHRWWIGAFLGFLAAVSLLVGWPPKCGGGKILKE